MSKTPFDDASSMDAFDDANDPYAAPGAPPVSRRTVARALLVLPVIASSVGCASVPRACVPRPGWTGGCRQHYCRYYRGA